MPIPFFGRLLLSVTQMSEQKQIIYLCLLDTTDPTYGILLPFCNALQTQKWKSKENMQFKYSFPYAFILPINGSRFFFAPFCACPTIQKWSLLQQNLRAHELDNSNGKWKKKCRKKLEQYSKWVYGCLSIVIHFESLNPHNKCFSIVCRSFFCSLNTKSFCR